MTRKLLAAALLVLGACAVATAEPAVAAPDDPARIYIAALIRESSELSLPTRVERAFLLTLNGANEAILRGEYDTALTLLRTFVFEVRSCKRARRIPAGVADPLIGKAEKLIATLTAPATR